MIHQPASSFYEAHVREFILEAEELLKLHETLTKVYVQSTGNPLWVIFKDMERVIFYVSNRSPSSWHH
ncbi:ATP-dependent Clp protease proteolytic subunit [Platanthera zijinensis]|uniref:ATP-dependent Clp protease proteolytic subunit n=1 Tax=Platanthera zijinensis TaxID=2320716 RepID=A0AAP0BZW1_9ASPA